MPDSWTFRAAVVVLGLAVVLGLGGLILLTYRGQKEIPEGIVAITSAAVGALAGLLAPGLATDWRD